MDDIHKDAMRYRWLKSRKSLELKSYPENYMKIIREDGSEFFATHHLSEGNTSHATLEGLDETIDYAISVAEQRDA